MKILLDENLPKRLKQNFSDFDIFTIRYKKWNGKKNSELVRLLLAENFEVLLTFDKNLQHQQNFEKFPISVLVLNAIDNTYETLQKLVPKIKEQFINLKIGVTEIKM